MSISLLDGGVTATTGGTPQGFKRTNNPVNNGYEYADVAEPNFFARQKVVLTARNPALQSDGTYSKMKITKRWVMPITKADGSISYNVARSEMEYDPESTATQIAELCEMGAQLHKSASFNDLNTAGTLPE